jgi:cell division protein FtsA
MQRIIVGIDVGTTKICTLVGQITDSRRLNILGVGLAPSKGLDKGVVVNIDDAVAAIESSIEKAERASGHRITHALVGVSGRHITSLNSRGVVAVQPDKEITRNDISRAVEAAQAVAIPTQREIIHVIPRAYVVDGNSAIRDPVGMSGIRLEVETHIVTGEVMAIQNLIRSVERAGVEIDDLVLQPLASGEAVLSAEDKERGVILVDIGGATTDLAIFANGTVWHTGVVPVGGQHFTNDLVYVLHTPQNTAEYLKLRYGSAVPGDPPEEDDPADLIDADTLTVGEKQQISGYLINEILQSRAEQVIDLITAEVRRSGYHGLLPAGIVLTGGAGQLRRYDEMMRDMLGLPVRIGVPGGLGGLSDTLDSPAYATAVGLLRWGARHGVRPTEAVAPTRGNGSSLLERLRGWLQELLP